MSYKIWVTLLQLQTIFSRSIKRCRWFWNQIHFYRHTCLWWAKWWWYIFCFYFVSLLGRLWISLTKACKFWGKWNRNAFRHPWWWGLSSKDVPNEAFREKGFVMWRTCFQLQAVASKAMHWVCLWCPNNKMAIVKQSNRNEPQ